MWFVDRTKITVIAGDGGRGCEAFAQPPYTRSPYPDGGDGGKGGDVIIRVDHNIATLMDFHYKHTFKAGRGAHGGGNARTGRGGEDCIVLAPSGTLVYDFDTGALLRDLTGPTDEIVVAKGGRGGFGNANAREAEDGELGEERTLQLELKLIADVGLIGFPNAGKSSLLSIISTAKPKVASYPFTTRQPMLGVVDWRDHDPVVVCDIPGIIEGAHEGKGMGMQFLRHVERTRILVHLIDMACTEGRDPLYAFQRLNKELESYSQTLAKKPQIIVANKMDVTGADAILERFSKSISKPIIPISCASSRGIDTLLAAIHERLAQVKTGSK